MESERVEKLQNIISEQLGIQKERIRSISNFIEDFGADELDMIELSMACEEEFGIEFTDEDMDKVKTVADLIREVNKALDKKGGKL